MNKALFVFILMGTGNFLNAQCVPAPSDNCESSQELCSLTELNGYSCKILDYDNPTGCSPLCPSGGVASHTSWWAFITNGGNVCITITYSNCSVNGQGAQMGIWHDCDCKESVACNPTCNGPGSKTICGVLEACRTYYLFVDGCSGDVCDYTFTTSGGDAPKIPPLNNITGPANICKGACNVKYGVTLSSGTCEPNFLWTLDGIELDQYWNNIVLDIPYEGDFVLCVTAIVGNLGSGSICDQVGPKCMTIKSRLEKDRLSGPRYICYENTPYIWQGVTVIESGEYRQKFSDKNCCEFDSVVNFVIITEPEPESVYYLACPGDFYIDPITRKKIQGCQDGARVILPKKSNPYRCDSSYNLFATYLELGGNFKEFCNDGKIFCQFLAYDNTCNVRGYETSGFEYKWYKKSDSLKNTLGSDEFFRIYRKDEYCVEINLKGKLDNLSESCTFTRCETLDETKLILDSICPKGSINVCSGEITQFYVDSLLPTNVLHSWSVTGGKIITQNNTAKRSIDILWDNSLSPGHSSEGEVCYQLVIDSCLMSTMCCTKINILGDPNQLNAGNDDQLKGLKYPLNAEPDGYGVWTTVSGPGIAVFSDIHDPNALVSVSRYGTYLFRWTVTCNSTYYDEVQISFQRLIISVENSDKNLLDTCCINMGIDTRSKEKIINSYTIIPNPLRHERLQIRGNPSGATNQLVVFDMQGTKIMDKKLYWNSSFQEIEFSPELNSGIYYLYIKEEDGTSWPNKLIVIE